MVVLFGITLYDAKYEPPPKKKELLWSLWVSYIRRLCEHRVIRTLLFMIKTLHYLKDPKLRV